MCTENTLSISSILYVSDPKIAALLTINWLTVSGSELTVVACSRPLRPFSMVQLVSSLLVQLGFYMLLEVQLE